MSISIIYLSDSGQITNTWSKKNNNMKRIFIALGIFSLVMNLFFIARLQKGSSFEYPRTVGRTSTHHQTQKSSDLFSENNLLIFDHSFNH
ncbi:MAG: hypothetical protein R2780_02465 [Crocinitomicaceae bacterium]|nr:hypothetical protein [Crocinitomicaceae bacterium]